MSRRVLQIVEASFAGVGRHVLDLTRHLVAAGWEVEVAYGRDRAEAAFLDGLAALDVAEVLEIDGGNGIGPGDVVTVRRLRSFVAERGHDVVHGHASKGGALARLVGAGSPAAVVYTPNALITQSSHLGAVRHRLYRSIEMALAPLTDHLIHVSSAEADHARAIGLRPRASSVIPNGIDPIELPTASEARAALDLGPGVDEGGPLRIGFVGRLDHQKNLGLLLDAFAGLRTDRTVELIVIGDGELRTEHEAHADRLDTPGPVKFLGRQPGAVSMPAFDVFALPSVYEGFPYVLLEALQAGVPCVATPPCAADVLLGDGRAGAIADVDPRPDQPDRAAAAVRFADALDDLLDDERRASASRAAREVAAQFTAAAMTDRVLDVYGSLPTR